MKYKEVLTNYRDKVGTRLIRVCDKIINMIKIKILKRLDIEEEPKAFFLCMLADYMRYKTEILVVDK